MKKKEKKEKNERKSPSPINKKIIILIIILAIIILMIAMLFVNKNKKKDSHNSPESAVSKLTGMESISQVVNNIYSDYYDGRTNLLGKKVSHSEAQDALSKINSDLILKMPNYDGFEVADEYYYYEVADSDFANYNIESMSDSYIVNYLTGEVICKNATEGALQYETYVYTRNLSTTNILGETITSYTISYDLGGGFELEGLENVTSYDSSMKFILNTPVKQGYIFVGWITDSSDEPNPRVTIDYDTTGDLLFSAVWEEE